MPNAKPDFGLYRLHSVDAEAVSQLSLTNIDRMHHNAPEVQVAALALSFVLLCRRFNVPINEAVQVAHNLLDRASHGNHAMGAVRDFLRHEV
jgi:hypothetical protein